MSGEDRLKFLHSQSTADVATRQPGESFDTVFTSSKVLAYLLICRTPANTAPLLQTPLNTGPILSSHKDVNPSNIQS